MKLKSKKIIITLGLIISLSIIMIYNVNYDNAYILKTNQLKSIASLSYNTTDHVYLSDLKPISSTVEPGNEVHYDKSANGTLITLNIDGNKKSFIKGLSAWASSTLIYDLNGLSYDYFTCYIGVDASQNTTEFNNGASFKIYTSSDKENWTLFEGDYTNKVFYAWSEAEEIKVPLKDVKYLKLETDKRGNQWWIHWYDDTVYADAKLIKENYKESFTTFDIVKPLSEYDSLKTVNYNDLSVQEEKALLQREFIKRVDYDMIEALLNYDASYKEVLSWLLNDPKILKLYLTGGEPDGNYISSLKVLKNLYDEIGTYFNITTKTKTQNKTQGELYTEMALALSLTHSANVGLWVTGAPEDPDDPNGSNAVDRFKIYASLYSSGLNSSSAYNFNYAIFDNLSIEEMRFVMNNIIDDEEIFWLNKYIKDNHGGSTNGYDPYTYITYTLDYNYANPIYQDPNRLTEWNNKRRGNLRAYQFKDSMTYGYQKLWIVFEEGAVCGGISKTGSNIWGVNGVPSSVISQPGHAAYIYMTLQNNQKVWLLGNDVDGWGMSGKTEKLSVRMPNGWGSGSYAGAYPASYILLAQAALNDFPNYQKSEEILMFTDLFSNDNNKLIEIYEAALAQEKLNFDAWLGLVNSYIAKNSSPSELYELEKRIASTLKNYPLPMHDLFRLIEPHMTTSASLASHQNLLRTTLKEASNTSDTVLQASAIRQVANYLLNNHDTAIASFSFDGENANSIVLSSRFKDNSVTWKYSIDGGGNWSNNINTHTYTLNSNELSHITSETGILVQIIGSDTPYAIEISKGTLSPKIYNNDLENAVIGIDSTYEWRFTETENWHSYANEIPDLSGNKTIYIRRGPTSNCLPSASISLNFTEDTIDDHYSYVPISRLNIHSFSSEQKGVDDAIQAIDGNIYTIWHTSHSGNDSAKNITLVLNHPTYISALEYIPRQDSGTNGIVNSARISVSVDGKTWEILKESTNWATNKETKKEVFDTPVLGNFIKIEGLATSGNFMSAAMFNIYEDKTLIKFPYADIEYDYPSITNQNVTAKLINESEDIIITDENGNPSDELTNTHTFTENGEYIFHYKSVKTGFMGESIAVVNWIDKETPTADISYSIDYETDAAVTATLQSSEEIIILNNDASPNYVFQNNGSFTFKYQDLAGNTNETTAEVNWIVKKEEPTKTPSTPSTSSSHNSNSNNSTNNTTTNDIPTNTPDLNQEENQIVEEKSASSSTTPNSNSSNTKPTTPDSSTETKSEENTSSNTEENSNVSSKEDANSNLNDTNPKTNDSKTKEANTPTQTSTKKSSLSSQKYWIIGGLTIISISALGFVIIKLKK